MQSNMSMLKIYILCILIPFFVYGLLKKSTSLCQVLQVVLLVKVTNVGGKNEFISLNIY